MASSRDNGASLMCGAKSLTLNGGVFFALLMLARQKPPAKPPLCTHHDIERSILLTVLEPNQKFPATHPLLSLCDGAAADAVHHQFAPEFILAG